MNFNPFPFVRFLLFFVAGIATYIQFQFFHISLYYIAGFLLITLLVSIRFKIPIIRGIFLWLLLFDLGIITTYHNTAINQPTHFSKHKDFQYYEAVITSNTEEKPKTYKVEAELRTIKTTEKWQPTSGKILLYFDKTKSVKPHYGDVFLVKGMPREVEAPKNPYEFDYRKFLQYKGIYAHHFLWGNEYVKIGNNPPSKIIQIANQANAYADSVFKAAIQTKNEYAVANAMVVGLRDDIDNDLLDAYSASGAIHVLSVSGMHVGILFLFLGWIFGWIKKREKHGKIYFTALVISILWLYAIFTGLSATVLRATVMFSYIQFGTALNRRQNIYNTLAISALLLLAWNPYWIIDVGFQLSYLAIIGIVFLHPYLKNLVTPTNPILRETWSITVVCFSAQLFTFPLSVYYFHQFPTYFLLANPFVAMFSFLVLPAGLALLIFAKIPIISTISAFVLKWSLILLNKCILLFEKIPFSTLKGFSLHFLELLAIYGIIFLIIRFFIESEIKFLKIAVTFLAALGVWNVYQDFTQSQQKELVFHFIPKKSGISIIDGKSATFIADSSLINNKKIYNFHLKNFFDNQGVRNKNLVDKQQFTNQNGMMFLSFEGKQILWLQEKFKGKIEGKTDYLLLSNNALRKLYPALQGSTIKQIIVDDSNKRYVVENLKHQADSLHIDLVSLYDSGAIRIK